MNRWLARIRVRCCAPPAFPAMSIVLVIPPAPPPLPSRAQHARKHSDAVQGVHLPDAAQPAAPAALLPPGYPQRPRRSQGTYHGVFSCGFKSVGRQGRELAWPRPMKQLPRFESCRCRILRGDALSPTAVSYTAVTFDVTAIHHSFCPRGYLDYFFSQLSVLDYAASTERRVDPKFSEVFLPLSSFVKRSNVSAGSLAVMRSSLGVDLAVGAADCATLVFRPLPLCARVLFCRRPPNID